MINRHLERVRQPEHHSGDDPGAQTQSRACAGSAARHALPPAPGLRKGQQLRLRAAAGIALLA